MIPQLLDDYTPPRAFSDDLLSSLPGMQRSRIVWLVGGARSGSQLHVDPMATCGWNACLLGSKRWCLIPPAEAEEDSQYEGESLGGVAGWFMDQLPGLQARAAHPPQSTLRPPPLLHYLSRGPTHVSAIPHLSTNLPNDGNTIPPHIPLRHIATFASPPHHPVISLSHGIPRLIILYPTTHTRDQMAAPANPTIAPLHDILLSSVAHSFTT